MALRSAEGAIAHVGRVGKDGASKGFTCSGMRFLMRARKMGQRMGNEMGRNAPTNGKRINECERCARLFQGCAPTRQPREHGRHARMFCPPLNPLRERPALSGAEGRAGGMRTSSASGRHPLRTLHLKDCPPRLPGRQARRRASFTHIAHHNRARARGHLRRQREGDRPGDKQEGHRGPQAEHKAATFAVAQPDLVEQPR